MPFRNVEIVKQVEEHFQSVASLSGGQSLRLRP